MKIEILNQNNEILWSKFLKDQKDAYFCFDLACRNIIKNVYKLLDLYLLAFENNKVVGICPAFIIKNKFFGKKLVSLPYFGYGGVISLSNDAQEALTKYLEDYTREKNLGYFELRFLKPVHDHIISKDNFTFFLDISRGTNEVWANLQSNTRNHIRKSEKFGLKIKKGKEFLSDFYQLYQKLMKRLGTPVHSFLFFKEFVKEFDNKVEIIVVEQEKKIVAGMILLFYGNIAHNVWAASDLKYSKMDVNNYLHWQAIKLSMEKGAKIFDFGRSEKNSGTYNFKKQWGTKIKQLYYQSYSPKERKFGFSAEKKKYRTQIKIWKKIPLPLTNLLGPKIRKFIP